jgi:hypothetical protein
MFWSDSEDFDNNLITRNEIYDCDRQGVYVGGETSGYISEENTMAYNIIHNNGQYTCPNGPGLQCNYIKKRSPCQPPLRCYRLHKTPMPAREKGVKPLAVVPLACVGRRGWDLRHLLG